MRRSIVWHTQKVQIPKHFLVRPVLQPTKNSHLFLLFLLKHAQNPLLIIIEPSSLPTKYYIFLLSFIHIDSQHILFDAISLIVLKAAMSAPLPRPSASAGDHRCRLPLSTSSSPPPLPPQPLLACCHYHRHSFCHCSVSAATAHCCRQCCRHCCHCRCLHRRCRFSFYLTVVVVVIAVTATIAVTAAVIPSAATFS